MTALLLQITISQGKEFWGDIFMCRSPGCIPIPMKKSLPSSSRCGFWPKLYKIV